MSLLGKEIPKPMSYIESKKVPPRPITNAFKYNPERVLKPSEHQTGEEPKKRISKLPPLLPGKRVSKTGKIYYEYRKNRSSIKGRLK